MLTLCRCNVKGNTFMSGGVLYSRMVIGAGLGMRPTTDTGNTLIDA